MLEKLPQGFSLSAGLKMVQNCEKLKRPNIPRKYLASLVLKYSHMTSITRLVFAHFNWFDVPLLHWMFFLYLPPQSSPLSPFTVCCHWPNLPLTCFTTSVNCSINDITAVGSLGNNCIGGSWRAGLYIYCAWSRTGSVRCPPSPSNVKCHKVDSINKGWETSLGLKAQPMQAVREGFKKPESQKMSLRGGGYPPFPLTFWPAAFCDGRGGRYPHHGHFPWLGFLNPSLKTWWKSFSTLFSCWIG